MSLNRPTVRVAVVPRAVPLPDYAAIGRQAALVALYADGMNGQQADVIGYDRGDPAHTFKGPVPAVTGAALSSAPVKGRVVYAPLQNLHNAPPSDPSLFPYLDAAAARLGRR